MASRLRSRLRAGGGGDFNVNALLFSGGEAGLDWNFADSSKVFQDSAGTTPGATSQPIGLIVDSSPNGNSGVQATAASRPTWDTDLSALADGVDDALKKAFALSQPATVFAVVKQVSWTSGDDLWDGANLNSMVLQQITATPSVSLYSGAYAAPNTGLTLGTYFIVTAVYNGASSSLQVNNLAATTGNPGAAAPGGFCLFSRGDEAGGSRGHVACKRVIVRAGTVDAATTASVKEGLANQFGITL